MKQSAVLIVLALCMSTFVSAGDKSKGTEMTGMLCDQKCVKADAEKAACDLTCTEHSGNAVFLDDQGKTWKVTNPEVSKGKMKKKVKIHCKQMEDQESIEILGIWG